MNEIDSAITAISPAYIEAVRDICTSLVYFRIDLPAEHIDVVYVPPSVVS